jgi:hypothetical protein
MNAELTGKEIIDAFRQDFLRIKGMGYVKSNRSHNTGIGKTFEDLIGVEENNFQLVDYMGFLELKSQRDYTNSMLTLFTKSPDFPAAANTTIREKFGVPDAKSPTMKIIHTTISGAEENTYKNKWGFKLDVDETQQKIFLKAKNLETGAIGNDRIYYTFQTLKCIIEQKCQNIAYINAESKKSDGFESFRYTNAVLLTGLSFEKFVKAVKEGIITYDVRIGVFKTGKNTGKTHDHGSGFRIKKDNIAKVFTITSL